MVHLIRSILDGIDQYHDRAGICIFSELPRIVKNLSETPFLRHEEKRGFVFDVKLFVPLDEVSTFMNVLECSRYLDGDAIIIPKYEYNRLKTKDEEGT